MAAPAQGGTAHRQELAGAPAWPRTNERGFASMNQLPPATTHSAPERCVACGDHHGSVGQERLCLIAALRAARPNDPPVAPHLCVACGHYHGSVGVLFHCLRTALRRARAESR
jgi:ribosomal protein S14